MDVYQAIKSRRTVRDYKPDLIPEDVLRKILQAARWAPSSSNTQKWSFIVIQDREILAKLGEVAKQGTFIGQAPLCIAIVMDDAPRPQLDAGRAENARLSGFPGVPGQRGREGSFGWVGSRAHVPDHARLRELRHRFPDRASLGLLSHEPHCKLLFSRRLLLGKGPFAL